MSPRMLDAPEVRALRTQFDALRRTAMAAAETAVAAETRRVPALYWPSRMTQRSLDKLHRIWSAAYDREIGLRMAQLLRVDAKIARICPDWPAHTVKELAEPPPPRGGGITFDSHREPCEAGR